MSKPTPIKRSDYHRVLLTETLPEDVPIIFGNEGFYHWMRRHYRELRSSSIVGAELGVALVDHFTGAGRYAMSPAGVAVRSVCGDGPPTLTIPFNYGLRVSARKRRTMSIVHPIAQNSWADFYRRRAGLILHFTGASAISLRAPSRVAARKYVPNDDENRLQHRLRVAGANTLDTHMLHRHASSYFAYSGYSKFYKFFDSPRFMRLERQFEVLWLVDVANCFGSIYTHSVAWALQSKDHAKSNKDPGDGQTFAAEFDRAMQRSNWDETNGIVVGPEVSRVFAELILQRVDRNCILALRAPDRQRVGRFSIHRYIDDYFVFASDELVAKEVTDQLQLELEKYHMTLNAQKSVHLRRPFVTARTRAIEAARGVLAEFFEGLLELTLPPSPGPAGAQGQGAVGHGQPTAATATASGRRRWIPRAQVRVGPLRAMVVRRVRALCADLEDGYGLIARFIIAALARKIAEICDGSPVPPDRARAYRDCISLLLELMLFFYAMEPTVGASVELASGALLATGHFNAPSLSVHKPFIERTIHDGCTAFLEQAGSRRAAGDACGQLEALNLVGVLGQLGPDHWVPWPVLSRWLGLTDSACNADYFSLMSAMHYVRDRPGYDDARLQLGSLILQRVSAAKPADLASHAELALLVLDSLACPYLDVGQRVAILRAAALGLKALGAKGGLHSPALQSGLPAQEAVVRWMESHPWFIDWKDVRLFRSLERLRVAPGYG